jgi:hypothetical protein
MAAIFFSRLLQPPKQAHEPLKPLDDVGEFDAAWTAIQVRRGRSTT